MVEIRQPLKLYVFTAILNWPPFWKLTAILNFFESYVYPFSCYCYKSLPFQSKALIVSLKLLFLFFIIKVFRFQRKTLLLFFGFFFFIILFFFLTRFLQNAWTDFHEIFRDSVYWSRKIENNFSCDGVTSGWRYWRFSDFQSLILCSNDLRNYTRYLLQIFTEDRQKTEVYKKWVSSLQLKKRQSAVGLENGVWKSVRFFLCFSAITLYS